MDPRLAALGVLLAIAPSAAAAGAGPALPKESRGKPFDLPGPPHSQRREHRPVHPLGAELRLGASVFAVVEEKARIRLATRPGGEPLTSVAPGKSIRLSWTEGTEKRSVLLAFSREDAGAWTWHAAQAVRHEVAGEDLTLYDGDGDGRYGDPERDGWSTGMTDQVLPLAKEFPLGGSLVKVESVSPDGIRLVAAAEPLPGSPGQVAAVVAVNRRRTAHGLPPVVLDPALSAACTAHATYLSLNAWTGYANPHGQDLGPKGASPEGLRAARRSLIQRETPEGSIAEYWRTWYHRVGLMSPWLARIGVNADPADISVVDVADALVGTTVGMDIEATLPWADPAFVPADGATGVPTAAGPELPKEPVPGLEGRGFPLMAVFSTADGLADFAGTLEEVRTPAPVGVPVLVGNPGEFPAARGIVPVHPLKAATLYRATFTWTREKRAESRTVRFRTE